MAGLDDPYSAGAAFDHAVLHLLPDMLAAARRRDELEFARGFDDLSADERDAFGHLILRRIAKDPDWPTWGWATNHTRWSYIAEGGAVLVAALDRWRHARDAREQAAAPDVRKKRLARTAFDLLRAGTSGQQLLTRLYAENEHFGRPLDPAAVDGLAVWCTRRHREGSHAR